MPRTGARDDIGPMPAWTTRWVYTGDWRDKEMALGQADLAGSWNLQVREGDPAKYADKNGTVPGLGKTITTYARPTLWLFDLRQKPAAADAIVVVNPSADTWNPDTYRWSGWQRDGAHQPDPFYAQYLLTGDYYYLEGMQLWAGAMSAGYPRGVGASQIPGAYISDQVRGDAWVLRNRVNAAVASPDSDPMKAVFTDMVKDALAFWEGQRNITGTTLHGTPMWTRGNTAVNSTSGVWKGKGIPPLHWWGGGYSLANNAPSYLINNVTGGATNNWMQDYVVIELGRAAERGFPSQKLLEWLGQNVIGQLTDSVYHPQLFSAYNSPYIKKDGTYFTSWADTLTGFNTTDPYIVNQLKPFTSVSTGGYTAQGRAAAAFVALLPGGAAAWSNFNSIWTNAKGNLSTYPMWALIPRSTNTTPRSQLSRPSAGAPQ
jgi:hypothetical protein